MSIQQGINQLLGMSMIGGKLSGFEERKQIKDLNKTIGEISGINTTALDAIKTKHDMIQEKESQGKGRKGMGMEKEREDLYKDNMALLQMQEAEAGMRKELLLKQPSLKNASNFAKAQAAIEDTKYAIQAHKLRKANLEALMTGGKPDGK